VPPLRPDVPLVVLTADSAAGLFPPSLARIAPAEARAMVPLLDAARDVLAVLSAKPVRFSVGIDMNQPLMGAVVWLILIAAVVGLFRRQRRRRGHVGPAAMGTIYDMLNEDKRNAVEIIVEQRAGERDPEDRDGNLPDLEHPKRKP
jgi:hypothetical protein